MCIYKRHSATQEDRHIMVKKRYRDPSLFSQYVDRVILWGYDGVSGKTGANRVKRIRGGAACKEDAKEMGTPDKT